MTDQTVIGRVGRHPSRPDRLSLIRPDGTILNKFALDDTPETLAPKFAAAGLTLHDDGTVTSP